jgi:hypothetical protein
MSMSSFEQDAYDLQIDTAKLKAVAPLNGGGLPANAVPTATTTSAGTVLMAAAQANSAAAPTQAEFNNLLAKLRTAGILAP